MYKIKPAVPYTDEDIEYGQYDYIFVGYPIWWGKELYIECNTGIIAMDFDVILDEVNHDNDINYLHGQEAGGAKRLAIRIYP